MFKRIKHFTASVVNLWIIYVHKVHTVLTWPYIYEKERKSKKKFWTVMKYTLESKCMLMHSIRNLTLHIIFNNNNQNKKKKNRRRWTKLKKKSRRFFRDCKKNFFLHTNFNTIIDEKTLRDETIKRNHMQYKHLAFFIMSNAINGSG